MPTQDKLDFTDAEKKAMAELAEILWKPLVEALKDVAHAIRFAGRR